jgi:outer membrane protein OmpA-like peptidoglycan-associated protein
LLNRASSALLIPAMALSFAGCETMRNNPKTTGAIVGGAVGAGAGMAIDDENRGRGAAIGAGAGALTGLAVGAIYERQRRRYEEIEGLKVQVATLEAERGAAQADAAQQRKEAIMLSLPGEILFAQGSSALTPQGTAKIAEVAAAMVQYPDSDVQVVGYASSEGSNEANVNLSRRRAEVIRDQLVLNRVAESRIIAKGMGSSNPIAANDTEAGRVLNRRVEIFVIPRG